MSDKQSQTTKHIFETARAIETDRIRTAKECYHRTLKQLGHSSTNFTNKPIPSNKKYLLQAMEEYQEAWICYKCEMEPT